jgi:hypothetical protein
MADGSLATGPGLEEVACAHPTERRTGAAPLILNKYYLFSSISNNTRIIMNFIWAKTMSNQPFSYRAGSQTGPAQSAILIAPSDDADLPTGVARGFYVGVAGVVRFIDSSCQSAPDSDPRSASKFDPLRIRPRRPSARDGCSEGGARRRVALK